MVATASLELGIDVGTVDLTCLIGSPRSIATALQRVGRSGHALGATPKGRLFPLTRDQLVECAALVRAARRGEIDRLGLRDAPLDILAQQIVAICACEEQDEDALFALVPARRALRRRSTATDFDAGRGHAGRGHRHPPGPRAARAAPRRGRRGGCEARRGARLAALTSGGAIPDNANYEVVLEPDETADRHARRGLRDRVHGGRRHPARQHLLAHPPRSRAAGCASRTRAARPHDPVLARRGPRAHARAVRRAVRGARRAWPIACDDPESAVTLARAGDRRSTAAAPCSLRDYIAAATRGAGRGAHPRDRGGRSASSTRRAACSSSSTRPSAAASTAPGAWPCASGSAAASTSSCRPRPPTTASCSRWARSTASRSRRCSRCCTRAGSRSS